MRQEILIGVACLMVCSLPATAAENATANAGVASQITPPSGTDEYSKLVARAAVHDESVDFRALRFAYLTSSTRKGTSFDDTDRRKDLFAAVKANDLVRARDAAIKLLSANYTDLFGHKFLRQACEQLHDDACAAQEHFVEFGLLNSILKSGDGKTCKTGWEVAAVSEEYFIIAMLGATLKRQALLNGSPSCDLLQVEGSDGKLASYNFRIDVVLKDEASMLTGGH